MLPGITLDEMAGRDDDAATETLAMVIRDYGRALDDPGSLGLRSFEEFAEMFERFDRGPHGSVARRKTADAAETRLSAVLGIDESGTALPVIRSDQHATRPNVCWPSFSPIAASRIFSTETSTTENASSTSDVAYSSSTPGASMAIGRQMSLQPSTARATSSPERRTSTP